MKTDEIPMSAPCPHCEDGMTFKGICYYTARELYYCARCNEMLEVEIPKMLPQRVVA
jgi:hypothetical protein